MHDWDDTTGVTDPATIKPEASQRDKAYLIVLAGANVGTMFKIEQGEITLGRSGDATIRLQDEGVSRVHCRLEAGPTAVEVVDLSSTNGTFVNDERVNRASLTSGDRLRVGRVELTIERAH